jgi:hypothetical protein
MSRRFRLKGGMDLEDSQTTTKVRPISDRPLLPNVASESATSKPHSSAKAASTLGGPRLGRLNRREDPDVNSRIKNPFPPQPARRLCLRSGRTVSSCALGESRENSRIDNFSRGVSASLMDRHPERPASRKALAYR